MKKVICALILPLVVLSGLVLANRESKNETAEKATREPPSVAEMKAEREKWEAGPDGINYKKWQASPAGQKVYAAVDHIAKYIREYTNMEAVVTALSLPPGSKLGFGVMVRMNGDDYILRLDDEPQQLNSLKVNDKIMIKSHYMSVAPKYAYPIISAEYVERNGKIIYKHAPRKAGC